MPETATPEELAAAFPPVSPPAVVSGMQMEGLIAAVYRGKWVVDLAAREEVRRRAAAVSSTLSAFARGELRVVDRLDGSKNGNRLGLGDLAADDPSLAKLRLRAAWVMSLVDPIGHDALAASLIAAGGAEEAMLVAAQLWYLPAGSGRTIADAAGRRVPTNVMRQSLFRLLRAAELPDSPIAEDELNDLGTIIPDVQ